MFETLEKAPPDAIFGLMEAYKKDSNPNKVDLTIGVYQDDTGTTPIFRTVKLAEARLLEEETDKSYLSIDGSPEYAAVVQELVFGAGHEITASGRAATAQTPGGTAALRVGAEFIKRIRPEARVWLSDPTWPNHPQVFGAAGLAIETYPYFDSAANAIAFDRMIAALKEIPAGDIVLLHGSCHNPTGADPTPEQWTQIANVIAERGLIPFIDFAYQGLGDGLREDAAGILTLCRPGSEMLIASSFSKNFGLYCERVGAMTVVTPSAKAAQAALSHAKKCIRANYSNPPSHGASIVISILSDPDLRVQWESEVQGMCNRINRTRRLFVKTLAAKGVTRDFSFIERQRGIFSYTGLTKEQAQELREKHSIYILDSGRMNVAGMNAGNIDAVCQAIADVL
ncbi:MAG: aspartate/tyrosine/aromatic aminotransferase [Anaerolineae bacterium]|nr:aspartate/tyrosine/aromatic aminotransferase [Anaerolineae bacterium]